MANGPKKVCFADEPPEGCSFRLRRATENKGIFAFWRQSGAAQRFAWSLFIASECRKTIIAAEKFTLTFAQPKAKFLTFMAHSSAFHPSF
jgi:hypothetical protein